MNYTEVLASKIQGLRKQEGLTQATLAEKLNISFQAVSKWESGQSSPDITLLPELSEIFGVSIDALFGREAATNVETASVLSEALPWKNDNTLHAAVFRGKRLLRESNLNSNFVFVIQGEALNVDCHWDLQCEDIAGNASAGGDLNCADVGKDASAGGDISCGEIHGNANSGGDLSCANVDGNASAGCDLNCSDVGGDAYAGCDLNCSDVGGDASAGCDLSCGIIQGNAKAGRGLN
jgi:transcriptional regulator with XRE-family HTH domain